VVLLAPQQWLTAAAARYQPWRVVLRQESAPPNRVGLSTLSSRPVGVQQALKDAAQQ
jgi:hypothetical protein